MSQDIVERLRGTYRIPITDGLGNAGGESGSDTEFVRFFPVAPIQKEAADEIESLRAERDKYKLFAIEGTEWQGNYREQISALQDQLAECQKERDKTLSAYKGCITKGLSDELTAAQARITELQKELETERNRRSEGNRIASDEWREECAAYQARIAELVEALDHICLHLRDEGNGIATIPSNEFFTHASVQSALSRTDNMEALVAYRDSVLEEAARTVEHSAPTPVGEPNGYGHSAWSDSMATISRYKSMTAEIRALKKVPQ